MPNQRLPVNETERGVNRNERGVNAYERICKGGAGHRTFAPSSGDKGIESRWPDDNIVLYSNLFLYE